MDIGESLDTLMEGLYEAARVNEDLRKILETSEIDCYLNPADSAFASWSILREISPKDEEHFRVAQEFWNSTATQSIEDRYQQLALHINSGGMPGYLREYVEREIGQYERRREEANRILPELSDLERRFDTMTSMMRDAENSLNQGRVIFEVEPVKSNYRGYLKAVEYRMSLAFRLRIDKLLPELLQGMKDKGYDYRVHFVANLEAPHHVGWESSEDLPPESIEGRYPFQNYPGRDIIFENREGQTIRIDFRDVEGQTKIMIHLYLPEMGGMGGFVMERARPVLEFLFEAYTS